MEAVAQVDVALAGQNVFQPRRSQSCVDGIDGQFLIPSVLAVQLDFVIASVFDGRVERLLIDPPVDQDLLESFERRLSGQTDLVSSLAGRPSAPKFQFLLLALLQSQTAVLFSRVRIHVQTETDGRDGRRLDQEDSVDLIGKFTGRRDADTLIGTATESQ